MDNWTRYLTTLLYDLIEHFKRCERNTKHYIDDFKKDYNKDNEIFSCSIFFFFFFCFFRIKKVLPFSRQEI